MESEKLYFEEYGEKLLKDAGMTKAEFARKLGICKQNVNLVFKTKNIEVLRKVADVLQVPFELLISYPTEPDFTGCTFYSDLVAKGRYINIVLPYDRGDELFTIQDSEGDMPVEDVDCRIPSYDEGNHYFDFTVDLESHRVGWWIYGSFRIWAKVCDSGIYTLLDEDMKPLLQIRGYVPIGLLPPKDKGWGDYIELCFARDGTITNWLENPDLMVFAAKGHLPKPIETNKWSRAESMIYEIKRAKLTAEELEWIKKHI